MQKKILFLKLLSMVMESKYDAEYAWCERKWIEDAFHLSYTSEKELGGDLVTVCHFTVDISLLSTEFIENTVNF